MKLRDVTLSLLIAGAAGAILFQSCGTGDGGGEDGNKQEEQTTEGKDVTKPFTIAIAGAAVDVPEGVFETGTKLSVKSADAPAEFAANADASAASKPVQLAATDANGAAISEAKAPFTLAIDLAAAGLAPVEKTLENLCVLNKGVDNVIRVWRAASLASATAAQVKILTKWMGVYMALYCGKDTFADAAAVNKEGTSAAKTTPGAAGTAYSCSASSDPQTGGYCSQYTGKAYKEGKDKAKTDCEAEQKTFSESGCSTDKVFGVCSTYHGTNLEVALFYYEGSSAAQVGAAQMKTNCESDATAKWFDGSTYVATAEADQTTATATDSNTNTNTNTNTSTPTETEECSTTGNTCMLSGGSQCWNKYADDVACEGINGTWSAGPCPTTDRIACCNNAKMDPGNPNDTNDITFYTGATSEGAAASCAAYSGTYIPLP